MRRFLLTPGAPPDLSQPDWPLLCLHRPPDAPRRTYGEALDVAAARQRRGEDQIQCPQCRAWPWETTPCPAIQERG